MTLTASSTGALGDVVYNVVPLMRRISLTSMAPPRIILEVTACRSGYSSRLPARNRRRYL